MKSRGICCLKLFLTTLNIICILSGLVLMAICVMNMRNQKPRAEQQAVVSRVVLSFLLTLALALVVSAVLGCVGALKENVKLLYVHSCFFVFLVLVQFFVGMGGAILTSGRSSGSELRVYFSKNTTVEDQTSHEFWDRLQSENQCCGVDGPHDYAVLHRDVPSSCCPRAHSLREGGARRHLHAFCLTEKTYFVTGCEDILKRKKIFQRTVFIVSGSIFIIIQSMCIILTVMMMKAVQEERRRLRQNLQAHFES